MKYELEASGGVISLTLPNALARASGCTGPRMVPPTPKGYSMTTIADFQESARVYVKTLDNTKAYLMRSSGFGGLRDSERKALFNAVMDQECQALKDLLDAADEMRVESGLTK